MATKASRIALAGSNISSTGEVDADLLDNIDSAAFLSLDGNDRLGIGTTNPLSGLHISDGTNAGSPQNASRKATLMIDAGATASADLQFMVRNGYNSHIFFGDAADPNVGMLWYDHTTNHMNFMANTNHTMTIDDNGHVGIGTTTPNQPLVVKRATDGIVIVANTAQAGGQGIGFFTDTANNRVGVFNNSSLSLDMVFNTGGTATAGEAMRIDNSTKNVGIGTTSNLSNNLGTLLNVNNGNIIGNGTGGSYFTYNARYDNSWLRNETSAVGIISLTNSGKLTYRTAVSGNAGTTPSLTEIIRTGDASSPAFVTFDGASQVRLTLGNEGTPGTNTANWIRGNAGYLQYNSASSGHTWEIGGTEQMRIHNDGNVGIGTTSPLSKLDVNGNIAISNAASPPNVPTTYDQLYLGDLSQIYNRTGLGLSISTNNEFGGSPVHKYQANGTAGLIEMFGNSFKYYNAPTGNAGQTPSWTNRFTIDATGITIPQRVQPVYYEPQIKYQAVTGGFSGGSASANTWYPITNQNMNNYNSSHGDGARGVNFMIKWTSGNVGRGYHHTVSGHIPALSANSYIGYQNGSYGTATSGTSPSAGLNINISHHTGCTSGHDIQCRLWGDGTNYGSIYLQIKAEAPPNGSDCQVSFWKV